MIDSSDILRGKILIVDDQQANVLVLEEMLRGAGYVSIASTRDPTEVYELHRKHRYDLILLDVQMPVADGFQVMERLKEIEKGPSLPVLVITAHPDHKLRAMKAGARDFVSKPFELPEVLLRVHNLLELHLLREEPMEGVAKSHAMRQLVDLASRVANVDSTVLITGESGSGKERIARLVHEKSPRAGGPFIAINCGAITETLLESELFGHARGAFTGATADRPGLFEAANGGTLLLDEVGEVSPGMQVKLLRVLQEREIRRVGENKTRPVDVRVLAATNRNLAQGVAGGAFRQDLYYRLKVVELNVPPLRQRQEDVVALARVLLAEAAVKMKRKISGLGPSAVEQILRYEWPGNVRELENAMERAVALARGARVELEDLPEEVRQAFHQPVATHGKVRPLEEIEKDYILAALELNGGNQTRTHEQLQIGAATLYRKLKKYGVIGRRRGIQRSRDLATNGGTHLKAMVV